MPGSNPKKRHEFLPAAATLAAAALCAFLGKTAGDAAGRYSGSIVALSAILTAGVFLLMILCGIMLLKKARNGVPLTRSKLVFPLILVAGLLFSLLLPPLSGPDESTHYATIYRYSNILMGKASILQKPRQKTLGFVYYDTEYRAEDAELIESFAAIGTDQAALYEQVFGQDPFEKREAQEVTKTYTSVSYTVIGYLPAILGLTIGRLIRLGASATVYLARSFNLLAAAALMSRSIRRAPFGGKLILSIALFPMTLHLMGTLSPDGILLAIAFSAYMEFTRLVQSERRLSLRDMIPFSSCCAMASLLKGYCAPLCLVALLIPPSRYQKKYQYVPAALMAVLFTAVALVIGNYDAIAGVVGGTGEAYHGAAYTLSDVLREPLRFLAMFVRSVFCDLPMLALTMPGYSLAAFSVQLPSYWFALAYLALAFLAALPERGDPDTNLFGGWFLIPIALLALIPAYGAMLLWWTPIGSERIVGVQGRYFLPVLPFALTALRKIPKRLPPLYDWAFLALNTLNGAAVMMVFTSILL